MSYAENRKMALKILAEQGLEAIVNPHALIGKQCGCGTCFCCAALKVSKMPATLAEGLHNGTILELPAGGHIQAAV